MFCITYTSQIHAAADVPWFSPCADLNTFRFDTGFDDPMNIYEVTPGVLANISTQNLKPCCQDSKALKSSLSFGSMSFQYDGGTSTDRGAGVLPDPFNPDNKMLGFWIRNPNIMGAKGTPVKGRVQMNIYNNKNVKHLKMSVRLFLHPDFKLLNNYPSKIDWLTLSEWWNNATWTKEKYPFRMSVNLYKEAGISPLYFQIHAQTYNATTGVWDKTLWQKIDNQLPVPTGKWMTLEYEIIEGGKNTGKFSLSVTPDGEKKVTVIDVKNYTHHPDDPNPDGLSHINPLKLYTSVPVINYLTSRGAMLQLYWDDLSLVGAQ